MHETKQKLLIAVLGILLVVAVGYIAYDKWQIAQQEQQLSAFQQGAQYGYQQAVLQLFQQALTCQPVPLYFNNGTANQTVNLIAVECLQQAQNQTT